MLRTRPHQDLGLYWVTLSTDRREGILMQLGPAPDVAGSAGIDVRVLRREFSSRGRRGLRRRPDRQLRVALHELDLVIPRGEVHGLLGPNGAGKTTLCRILSTVLLPTSGSASVAGHDVVSETEQARRSVGVVFGGDRGLYGRLSPNQTLRFWAAMYELPARESERRIAELLDQVGLAERADDRVETFSRGMKQRLHLARGLIADPPVVILDEPTTGLDPVAGAEFRALLGMLGAGGRTVLLTTHDMAEAEAVCDRVTLLDEGRVLATERPDALGAMLSRYEIVEATDVPEALAAGLIRLPGVTAVNPTADPRVTRIETAAAGAAARVLAELGAAGVSTVRAARPSLEEVYLRYIGRDRGLSVG
jgi:ABC-2 type transport system ATP-binding protein